MERRKVGHVTGAEVRQLENDDDFTPKGRLSKGVK